MDGTTIPEVALLLVGCCQQGCVERGPVEWWSEDGTRNGELGSDGRVRRDVVAVEETAREKSEAEGVHHVFPEEVGQELAVDDVL